MQPAAQIEDVETDEDDEESLAEARRLWALIEKGKRR